MREFFCLVRKHDRHHLELKSNLPIPLKGKGKYDLNFYFFSSAQLHFTKKNISNDTIIRHIQTYTRFSSPALPLTGYTDPSCELSPLTRINGYFTRLDRGETIEEPKIVYELQTMVNGFRGEVKDFTELLQQIITEDSTNVRIYKNRIREMIAQMQQLLDALRALFPRFLDVRISDATRTALSWSDEALGLIAIRNAIRLHVICESDTALENLVPYIDAFIEKEDAYRTLKEYKSSFKALDEHAGETLAYRESMLKKWSQSSLYMRSMESRVPQRIGHILAGTAAATAMTFAVLAAFYAEQFFVRNSASWGLIIILSYVFKDRIKEILRDLFGRLLPRLLADRIYRLQDPVNGKDVARSQVIIKFGVDKDQPQEIQKERDLGTNPFKSILPPQNVMHYNRLISVQGKTLLENHSRLDAITEITRIRIDDWLKEMDDPEEIHYKLEDGKRKRVSGNRVYHIHLIASLKEDRKGSVPRLFHYCLVLNRSGILRVEPR
jgi:hypothetical protein